MNSTQEKVYYKRSKMELRLWIAIKEIVLLSFYQAINACSSPNSGLVWADLRDQIFL